MICKSNTSFLIILKWDAKTSLPSLQTTFEAYFSEKQSFEILVFTDVKRPKENFAKLKGVTIIAKNDFKFLGGVKSKQLLPTEHTHFDVALILEELTPREDKVVQTLKINHNVGFGYERNFVNINLIQMSSQPTEKIKFAKEMLSKLSD